MSNNPVQELISKFNMELLSFARYGGRIEDAKTDGKPFGDPNSVMSFFVSVPSKSHLDLYGEELARNFRENMQEIHTIQLIPGGPITKRIVKVYCKVREEEFTIEDEELSTASMIYAIQRMSGIINNK